MMFERLLEDVQAGKVNGIVYWHRTRCIGRSRTPHTVLQAKADGDTDSGFTNPRLSS